MVKVYFYDNNSIIYKKYGENTDTMLYIMEKAIQLLMNEVCYRWNINDIIIKYQTSIPKSACSRTKQIFVLVNDMNSKVNNNHIPIPIKSIIENDGHLLYISDDNNNTIAATLFREITASIMDYNANTYWAKDDKINIAFDICDPVHSNCVIVEMNNQKVGLSDFIYPHWLDNKKGKHFNYRKTLTTEFSLDNGGCYLTVNKDGSKKYIYQDVPEWIQKNKETSYRYIKRVGKVVESSSSEIKTTETPIKVEANEETKEETKTEIKTIEEPKKNVPVELKQSKDNKSNIQAINKIIDLDDESVTKHSKKIKDNTNAYASKALTVIKRKENPKYNDNSHKNRKEVVINKLKNKSKDTNSTALTVTNKLLYPHKYPHILKAQTMYMNYYPDYTALYPTLQTAYMPGIKQKTVEEKPKLNMLEQLQVENEQTQKRMTSLYTPDTVQNNTLTKLIERATNKLSLTNNGDSLKQDNDKIRMLQNKVLYDAKKKMGCKSCGGKALAGMFNV